MLDPDFAARITALARSFHVWVVESPGNLPTIEQFRNEDTLGVDLDPLATGITSFKALADGTAHDRCARIAEDVDEHHGEFAHDPPWSEIHVYGATLDRTLQETFASLGATSFETTPDGFICRR